MQHLDRHPPLVAYVSRQEDGGHSSMTEFLFDLVPVGYGGLQLVKNH
jgi:hypothetical protein